jgi:mycoredoxin-dependent peroxiredoxin
MPVNVGSSAPDFTLKDQNNQEVRLAQFRGRKPVLLVFYPLTFTGTCQGELTEIQQNLDEFGDVQVLAASVDSVYAHKVWALDRGFDFPLLADFWPHGAVARSYDVFDAGTGVAGRGTFLIDAAGVIRFAELAGPGEARDQKRWHAEIAALKAESPAR